MIADVAPPRRAEGDDILLGVAIHQRRRSVKSVAEVAGAGVLEHARVRAALACLRLPVRVSAAENVEVERQARALARYHGAATPARVQDLQLLRAEAVDVLPASADPALGVRRLCGHRDGEVVAVDQAHVVETRLALFFLQRHLRTCFNLC